MPFGLPGWRAFLERQVANLDPPRPRLRRAVKRELDAGRFEAAAERIIRAVKRNHFDLTLEAAFGDDAVRMPSGKVAVALLSHIASGPVVTTNFDHVLEKVFRDAQRTFDLVLWGAKVETASDVLAEDLHVLLKLHGDVLDDEDRVLTRREYARHYGANDPDKVNVKRPLPVLLDRLFRTRSVLFLGCSLEGDRYMQLLRRVREGDPPPEHFACVVAPEAARAFRRRERFLHDCGITPIWLRPGEYGALVPLLAALATSSRSAVKAQRSGIPLSFGPRGSHQDQEDRHKSGTAHARRRWILARWRRLGEARRKIAFLRRHGEPLYNGGFYRDYIALATEAAAAAKSLGEWSDQAEFLYNMHLAWRGVGRNDSRADGCLAAAERVLRRCPLSNLHGKAVHDLAHLLAERGAYKAAAKGYRQAIKLIRRSGDARLGTSLIGLGRVLEELGNSGTRVRYARRAIKHAARHREKEEEGRAWLALAAAHADGGKAKQAREAQERAVVLLSNAGDSRTLARALNDLGASCYDEGNLHAALSYFLRGIWWDQQAGNQRGLSSGLSNIAWLHWEAAQDVQGLSSEERRASLRRSAEYFSQAVAVQRALGDQLEVARLLVYRAMVLPALGRTRKALGDLRAAFPVLRKHRDETSIAVALNNRGTIEEKLDRPALARRSYTAAIRHADRGPEVGIRRTARENLNKLLRRGPAREQ